MTKENNQVVQTVEALVETKSAERSVKQTEAKWSFLMTVTTFSLMMVIVFIAVVFNDWAVANNEWFINVVSVVLIGSIFLLTGIGLWKTKQQEKEIMDYEKDPSIDQTLFSKLSILSNDSFLYTANELLKENGSDKQLVQLESNEMLFL